MRFNLNLPNDYESEADDQAAEDAGGYGAISDAAQNAGLTYVRDTDYGAIWEGTREQFAACVANLPAWATRYASPLED